MWSVVLRDGHEPIHMELSQLLSYFPTLDLREEANFLSKENQQAILQGLPTEDGYVTQGDTRMKFACSDMTVTPNWTQGRPFDSLDSSLGGLLQEIQTEVGKKLTSTPNYVLVNVYRDGNDEILWHADDTEGVAPGSSIASVSIGAERIFQFRPYVPGNRGRTEAWPVISTRLKSGSLLLMGPQTNEFWCHRVPQEPSISGTRVNLTFRLLLEWTGVEPKETPGTANYRRLEQLHKSFAKGEHPVYDNPNFAKLSKERDELT